MYYLNENQFLKLTLILSLATMSIGTVQAQSAPQIINSTRFVSGGQDNVQGYSDIRSNPNSGNMAISAKSGFVIFNFDHGAGGTFWADGGHKSHAHMSQTGQLTLNNSTLLQSFTVPAIRNTLDANGGIAVGSYANMSYAPTNGMIVSGKVGVGNPNPTQALDVTGNIKLSGSIVSDGDICIGKCQ
jgi:hypothetical protein